MEKLFVLINEALDSMEDIRTKLIMIQAACENEEGCDAIVTAIHESASKIIAANDAIEGILSAIEDQRDV